VERGGMYRLLLQYGRESHERKQQKLTTLKVEAKCFSEQCGVITPEPWIQNRGSV
jgi:hypothetical protein